MAGRRVMPRARMARITLYPSPSGNVRSLKYHVDWPPVEHLERLGARASDANDRAPPLQAEAEKLPRVPIVLDHEHPVPRECEGVRLGGAATIRSQR